MCTKFKNLNLFFYKLYFFDFLLSYIPKERLLNQEETIKKLKEGEIVVYPTDTLFGLLAKMSCKESIEKIYRLKKRDENKPLLVLTNDFRKLIDILEVERWHYFFIEEWPNYLTLIFKIKEDYKEKLNYLHRGKGSLAVRVPKDKELLNLLKEVDEPLVAPSANFQGLDPAKNIKEAYNYFKDQVYYLDTKKELKGLPSTIVDLSSFPPKIIREGKFRLNFFYFRFEGHPLIKASHKYTFEITKEDYLTENGDCIIGIKGFSNREFQEKTKNLKNFQKISFFIFSNHYYDKGIAYLLKNNNPSNISFVVRRSSYVDDRTGLVKSNKTAKNINKKLINKLKEGKEAYIMFKDVNLESLVIDLRSLFENEWLDFLPRRLRRRIDLKKERDLFDKDILRVIKKEKIKGLEVIKEEFYKKLLDNKDVLIEKINKIKEIINNKFNKVENIFILRRSLLFDFHAYEDFGQVIDLEGLKNFNYKSAIFSNNDYLLRKMKKKGLTTISQKNKYFVDLFLPLES